MGVDVNGLRPVQRIRAVPRVPRVLRGLLRCRAFRAEGRLAGDRPHTGSPRLSQLVPAPIPVRLCLVPLHGEPVTDSIAEGTASAAHWHDVFADDVCAYLQRSPRQLPSKYLYDDLGSALFEAI